MSAVASNVCGTFAAMWKNVGGVGSAQPTAAPKWATMEVAHGGFVTGRPLAALAPGDEANEAWVTRQGQQRLATLLHTGAYTIRFPENGALLVRQQLLADGRIAEANDLLDTIRPFFEVLRFYPYEDAYPQAARSPAHVAVLKTEAVLESLRATVERRRTSWHTKMLEKMRESVAVYKPLEDRFVALCLRCDCGANALAASEDSLFMSDCTALVAETRTALAATDAKLKSLRLMQRAWERFLTTQRVSGGDAKEMRAIAASRLRKRTDKKVALQVAQMEAFRRKDGDAARHAALSRLEALPPHILSGGALDEGTAEELLSGLPEGASVRRRLAACCARPLHEHVASGAVASPDVLSYALQQLCADCQMAGGDSAEVGQLWAKLYTSFRARRSVLLLNFERQVTWEEVPWMACAKSLLGDNAAAAREAAKAALSEVLRVVFTTWPERIVPNMVLKEFKALIAEAGLAAEAPLTEELAVDLFMGGFSPKWLAAARGSARMLQGTTYEAYYRCGGAFSSFLKQCEENIAEGRKGWWGADPGTAESEAMKGFNAEAAEFWVEGQQAVGNARSGGVIEGAMILTTHNLAAFVDCCPGLYQHVYAISEVCLAKVLKQFKACVAHTEFEFSFWRSRYEIKDFAYGFRQLVFFLSLLPRDLQLAILDANAEASACGVFADLRRVIASGETLPWNCVVRGWHQGCEQMEWLRAAWRAAADEGADAEEGAEYDEGEGMEVDEYA